MDKRCKPYKPEMAERAYRLCVAGADMATVAKDLNISRNTLFVWRKHRSELDEAIERGRQEFDEKVINALARRALGYDLLEKTHELRKGKLVLTKTVTKHLPPDVGAMAFWLKNRQPDKWKDRHEMGVDGGEGKPIQIVMYAKMQQRLQTPKELPSE